MEFILRKYSFVITGKISWSGKIALNMTQHTKFIKKVLQLGNVKAQHEHLMQD